MTLTQRKMKAMYVNTEFKLGDLLAKFWVLDGANVMIYRLNLNRVICKANLSIGFYMKPRS